MRRSFLLKRTVEFLEKNNFTSCFEVALFSPNQYQGRELNKTRVLYLVNMEEAQREEILAFFAVRDLTATLDFHSSLDSLLSSSRFYIEESMNEINWRGRVLRYGDDFTFDMEEENFEKKFLRSYVRLLVSRVNGQYFSKHDITPILYSTGTSTAGFEDFQGGVGSFVKFINRPRNEFYPLDPEFDYLKVFISDGIKQPYRPVNILGMNDLSILETLKVLEDDGESAVVDSIYLSIKNEF